MAEERLVAYLSWTAEAARALRNVLRPDEVDRLIFTHHYSALLQAAGTDLAADISGRKIINGLLSLELDAREAAFREAEEHVKRSMDRWGTSGMFILCDTNFYLHHDRELGYIDFHQLVVDAGGYADVLAAGGVVTLLIPSRVIYELDKQKTSTKKDVPQRARRTLVTIDRWFEKPDTVHRNEADGKVGPYMATLLVELLIDPIGHRPLEVADDEIVDRILAAQPLAARQITLITYDTNMSTKARHAGVKVIKLQHQP